MLRIARESTAATVGDAASNVHFTTIRHRLIAVSHPRLAAVDAARASNTGSGTSRRGAHRVAQPAVRCAAQ